MRTVTFLCPSCSAGVDAEGSHSPSSGFPSVILEGGLAYKCCLAEGEGRTCATRPRVCLAVWKVEHVYTGRWHSHGKQGLKDALAHDLSRLLHLHPTNPANTSDVCLTWCYSPHVTITLQHSELASVLLSWLVGTSVRPVTNRLVMWLSAPCPSILHCKELLVTLPSQSYSPIWRLWRSLSRLNKYRYSHSP